MEYSKETIELKVKKAVYKLLKEDLYLLQNDLHERTISHKLASYLQEEFTEHNVDCEYNKNVDEENGLKNIRILEAEYEKFKEEFGEKFAKGRHQEIIDDILYSVISIYPDIIVHRRNRNDKNLLIIEVKKTTNKNKRNIDYDKEKLKSYTDPRNHNKLKYEYGLLITFKTDGTEPSEVTWRWFKKGKEDSDEIMFNVDLIANCSQSDHIGDGV